MKSKSSKKVTGTASTKKNDATLGSKNPLVVNSTTSSNIRQIENGFIISESGTTGKGRNTQYWNKDYFSPTNPLAGVKSVSFGSKKK